MHLSHTVTLSLYPNRVMEASSPAMFLKAQPPPYQGNKAKVQICVWILYVLSLYSYLIYLLLILNGSYIN